MDNGQGAQAKEVHLEQAKALNFHHVELGNRQTIVGGKRHILGSRFAGNHNARRMSGSVARHALHFQRGIDQLMHLRIFVIDFFEFRISLKCFIYSNADLSRDHFCD